MACTSFCVSLIFFMIVVSCQCMPSDVVSRQRRVVGGHQYEKGDHPYHVSLWYMGENNPYTANTTDLHHTCGGTLIGESWVLTSGLCFDDNLIPGLGNFSLWRVSIGMHEQTKAENDSQFRSVENVFISPEYNLRALYGDLALIQLDRPANLFENVSIIGINNDDNCPAVNEDVVAIGWGQTQGEVYGLGSDDPYEKTVQVVNLTDCQEKYTPPEFPRTVRMDDSNMCAGVPANVNGHCYGDAGSPLLGRCGPDNTSVVVGTASYGYGCGLFDFPMVYTSVSAYYDWIMETVSNNTANYSSSGYFSLM